jgi:hypothetical protein
LTDRHVFDYAPAQRALGLVGQAPRALSRPRERSAWRNVSTLNGALVSNIVINTTQAATDTIDYVATDTWGNTATSTRTVIIDASPSIIPTNEATTTASTTP